MAGPVTAANAAASPASASATSSTTAASSTPSASKTSASSTPSAQQQAAQQQAAQQKAAQQAAQKPHALPANAAVAKAKPAKQSTKPVQPVKAAVASKPSSAVLAARATAARSIIAHSDVPDTCSGAIAADTVYPCSTPSSSGTDTFTVTLTSSHDLLVFDVLNTGFNGGMLPVSITPPGGTATACTTPTYTRLPGCATSGAGTYTIQVTNYGDDYTIDYLPLLSDPSCTAVDPSFATWAPLTGTIDAGVAGACFSFNAASGDVIHDDSIYGNSLTVYDSTGTAVCDDDQGDCTLSGVAPYRLLATYTSGGSYSYGMLLKDVTNPTGCIAAAQEAYGVAPDTSSPVLCRTLTVTQAGSYQVSAVAPVGYSGITGTLYTPAGVSACTNSGPFCQLAAGTYDYVINGWSAPSGDGFGVDFIAANESGGCTASGDTDFQGGDATGTFAGNGAEACLTLPTASGKSDYIDEQENSDGTYSQILYVLDSTGAPQCAGANFSDFVTCNLTGTAPFRVVVASGGENSANVQDTAYSVLVQRTDSTTGCADWPQSAYGGSPGASLPLTSQSDFGCLSIPAAQHSTGEMIDWYNNGNTADGSIAVYDPSGNLVCIDNSTVICSYTAGVTYLALVYFAASPGVTSDDFHMVRRDVSQTAPCSTPASTTVGGASTSIDLTSDIDAVCERVKANAGDRLYFQVRTESPYQTGAVLEVANAAGTIVCHQWGPTGCPVTGSTSYQAIVIASGYNGVTIAAHLDSLLVGSSSGWASQCTAHSLSATGWAPTGASLSETASSYCAVVAIQPNQRWDTYGTDTAPASELPLIRMFSTEDWAAGGLGLCASSTSDPFLGVGCESSSTDTGEAVLLMTLGTVQGSTGFSLQGVCDLTCTGQPGNPTISSLSAASQPQGSANTLTVNGANLNLGTVLQLFDNGTPQNTYSVADPTSLGANGTSLTYSLNTTSVPPGTYQVGGGTNGGFCPPLDEGPNSCLPYTVTASPSTANQTYNPVTPDRILDTRKGIGAPKAQIPASGVLPVTAGGVDGVPTSGVTAVELDLTAVDEATGGDLDAYAYGAARATTSVLNFSKGQVITNLVTVPVSQGKIDLFNGSTGLTDLIADIWGYYTTSSGGSLYTGVTPARVLDSSTGVGVAKAPIAGGATVPITVTGVGGVPATGVSAVALNLTASDEQAGGYVTAYPFGATRPVVSGVNYLAGQRVTSLVVVPVVQGQIDVYNSGETIDLAADIVGYFSASGSGYQPLGPERVMDTRYLLGGAGGTVPSGGVAMLPASALTDVPGSATSLVIDVVVVDAQQAGTLTVTQDGEPLPGLSNLAYPASLAVAGQMIVPTGTSLDFYNGSGGSVQVLADVEGYYTS